MSLSTVLCRHFRHRSSHSRIYKKLEVPNQNESVKVSHAVNIERLTSVRAYRVGGSARACASVRACV